MSVRSSENDVGHNSKLPPTKQTKLSMTMYQISINSMCISLIFKLFLPSLTLKT